MLAAVGLLFIAATAGAQQGSGANLAVESVSPGHAQVGGTTLVEVSLRNSGEAPISAAAGFHLEARWAGPDGVPIHDWTVDEKSRYAIGGEHEPGDSFVLRLPLRAVASGKHELAIELVKSGRDRSAAGLSATISAWREMGMLATAMFALVVVGTLAARRFASALPIPVQTALSFLPVFMVWAAAVLTQFIFSETTSLPLHDGAAAYIYAMSVFFALPVALVPARLRNSFAALIVMGLATLTFCDVIHLRAFGSIVSVASLSSLGQLPDVHASVRSLLHAYDLPLAAVFLTGVTLQFSVRLPRTAIAWDRAGRALFLIAFIVAAPTKPYDIDTMVAGHFGRNVYTPAAVMARLGLHATHVFDVGRALREGGLRGEITDVERRGVVDYFRDRASRRQTGPDFGAASGHDLIIIQGEAIQEWVINLRVEGEEVTPFLNGLARRAAYFPNILDQTRDGNTSDCEYLVLNSQHPLPAGAIAFRRESNNFLTLAHVLADNGYATVSAHPGVPGFWNRAHLHPRYGFERTYFARDLGKGETIGWGLADEEFFERMADRLLEAPSPYFGFLVAMGLHHPFDTFPEKFKEMDVGVFEGSRIGNYLHGARHFDRAVSKLFQRLQDAGRLERTVIAIYGDHDSHLQLTRPLAHLIGLNSWDPSLETRLDRVPFLVSAPAMNGPSGSAKVGGQLDFAPTLLDLLGLGTPASFAGHSLFAKPKGFAARVDGVALASDRIFVPLGRGIPAGGACFSYPNGAALEPQQCAQIVQQAQAESSASVAVADHDLARAIP